MRIVGGAYRSRVLSTFDGDRIRPTSDKVRESLFNILQFKVIGCEFLDLFCGSGAVGLEAVSRGAKHVYFNDGASESLALAKKNALALKVENATFTLGDALRFFDNSKSFDIIFLDPPYKSGLGEKVLPLARFALNEGGVIVLEDEVPFSAQPPEGLYVSDTRKYGRAYLTFFKKD